MMAEYDIFGDEMSPSCKKCACVLDNVSIDCQHEGKDGYCKRCCKECAVTNGITILGVKNQTTFKSKLCNFWFKHIRMRFARVYTCKTCDTRFMLKSERTECPSQYCSNQPAECKLREHVTFFTFVNEKGICDECGHHNKLNYMLWDPRIWFKDLKDMMSGYFEINKHDQWIGHYYKTEHYEANEFCDKSHTETTHYICIIPCIVFKFCRDDL